MAATCYAPTRLLTIRRGDLQAEQFIEGFWSWINYIETRRGSSEIHRLERIFDSPSPSSFALWFEIILGKRGGSTARRGRKGDVRKGGRDWTRERGVLDPEANLNRVSFPIWPTTTVSKRTFLPGRGEKQSYHRSLSRRAFIIGRFHPPETSSSLLWAKGRLRQVEKYKRGPRNSLSY